MNKLKNFQKPEFNKKQIKALTAEILKNGGVIYPLNMRNEEISNWLDNLMTAYQKADEIHAQQAQDNAKNL